MDYKRNRRIVKLAASKIDDVATKAWLIRDENAVWQKEADRLLDLSRDKAADLGLTTEQHDAECANYLAVLALDAAIAFRKNNP